MKFNLHRLLPRARSRRQERVTLGLGQMVLTPEQMRELREKHESYAPDFKATFDYILNRAPYTWTQDDWKKMNRDD